MIIIIFGVSGVGKTTIGTLLANDLGWQFYDADDFHSAANVAKMRSGTPLNDEDRKGWLESLHNLIIDLQAKSENAVLACSALKRSYREYLFVNMDVKGVLLQADFSTIANRMGGRSEHFMNPALLQSQFDTLELPDDEQIFVLDASKSPADLLGELRNLNLSGSEQG
ncbi:gluconokinase [soil metagenome]